VIGLPVPTLVPPRTVALVLAGAVLFKLSLISLLPYRLYYDVVAAINFGKGYLSGGSDQSAPLALAPPVYGCVRFADVKSPPAGQE
jgi:hypothetical protein